MCVAFVSQTYASDDPAVCETHETEVHARFATQPAGRWSARSIEGTLYDPAGKKLETTTFTHHDAYGTWEIERKARGCGTYSACFKVVHGSANDNARTQVEIDYFQALHAPGGRVDEESSEKKLREMSKAQTREGLKAQGMDEAHAKVSGLNNWVQQLRQELNYLRIRGERHKRTVESNARRTVRWTFVEVLVLISVTGVQVVTVKKFFDVQTRVHENRRATMGGGGGGSYRNSFGDQMHRVAGPMAGMAADAAQRGVAGLKKSLGIAGRDSRAYHLG